MALVFKAFVESNGCSLAIAHHENSHVMQTQQPPLSIGHKETIATNEHAFSARCRKIADAIHPGGTITLSIVTTSIHWGLVWRADYVSESEGTDSSFDWRVVCWIPKGQEDYDELTVLNKIVDKNDSPLVAPLHN